MQQIRNFSIIAHIDHGKSTLADRFIQKAGLVSDRQFRDQLLDSMDLERERGITIKSQTCALPYRATDGQEYLLNLIDTPGHVDFTYEVSRALASCEGVVLLIDATQGVEAQTVANLYLALEHDLEIIPVINKIDLPSADVEMARLQITQELGLDGQTAILASGKEGIGVEEICEAIVRRVPPPKGDPAAPLRALIFDAVYDSYRGVIASVRVVDGSLSPGQSMLLMSTGKASRVEEVGVFQPGHVARPALSAGEVGYIVSGVKTVSEARIGDTVTRADRPAPAPLGEFKPVKPVVFSSIYPVASDDYPDLADALEKYILNDAALTYVKDSSAALGQGFRCGFLGLLHLEIFSERMEREFDQSIIMTVPSVQYQFELTSGQALTVDNPAHYPDPGQIVRSLEPFIKLTVMIPERYLGAAMNLVRERRAEDVSYSYPSPGRMELTAAMPLAEVIYDFHDKLKSVTQGYGSFDYEITGYRESELVKLDILVNGEKVDALSQLVHRERARPRALLACEKLREEIPRQMFKIAIQGAIGSTIIARETINPFRKDVTAKCYGGDITRKRKLLEKQAKGKRRMKMVGKVMIPQSAYVAVLKSDNE